MLCPMISGTTQYGFDTLPEFTPVLRNGTESVFLQRFLARVPAEVASSFSAEQLAAVQRAFGMRYTVRHAVDMRRSLALPWGRYYLVVMAGRERARPRRVRLAASLVVAASLGVAILLACEILGAC